MVVPSPRGPHRDGPVGACTAHMGSAARGDNRPLASAARSCSAETQQCASCVTIVLLRWEFVPSFHAVADALPRPDCRDGPCCPYPSLSPRVMAQRCAAMVMAHRLTPAVGRGGCDGRAVGVCIRRLPTCLPWVICEDSSPQIWYSYQTSFWCF